LNLNPDTGGTRKFFVEAKKPAANIKDDSGHAFQLRRYWLDQTATGDPSGLGLDATGHPLLGGALPVADRDEIRLTGRISRNHPAWLADHTVDDVAVLPGTALLELAAWAGDRFGFGTVAELTHAAPVVLGAQGALRLQCVVGPDTGGTRRIDVYSQADGAEDWTPHATGTLSAETPAAGDDLLSWPPEGAVETDVTDVYERVAADGYGYGPAFRNLRRLWRRDGELFAEVRPIDAGTGHLVHPALLDAALHPLLPGVTEDRTTALLPFSWSGVRIHAAGTGTLRVRLTPLAGDTVAVLIADGGGLPVASVESLALRPLAAADLRGPVRNSLLGLDWEPIPEPVRPARIAVLGDDRLGLPDATPVVPDLDAMTDVPDVVVLPVVAADGTDAGERARATVHRTLATVQQWLADPRFAHARLAVVTRPEDLAHAPVTGLIRSARTEHPGRFQLVGQFVALRGGSPLAVSQLGSRKGRTLLKVLLVHLDETVHPEIAFRRRGRPDRVRLVREQNVWRRPVRLQVHRDRLHPQLSRRTDDPDRNLTPIRD
jgi:5-hydroxydodecatetraenal polyketide synthase CpkA